MPTSCCAYNCTERYVPGAKVSFHRFPSKNEMLFRAWCIALRRKDFHPTEGSRICSKHFTEDCFTTGFKCRLLKKDAMPTIFNFEEKSKNIYKKIYKNPLQNSTKKESYKRQGPVDSSIYGSMTLDELHSLRSKELKNIQCENEVLRQTIFQLNKKIEEFKNLNIIPSDDLFKNLYDDESSGSSKICTSEEKPKSVEIITIKREESFQCNEYEYHQEQLEESADRTTVDFENLVKTESKPRNQLKNLRIENEVLQKTIQDLKKVIKRIKCLAHVLRSHDLI